MILTERTITIIDHNSVIDSPVVLYRGDKNVELKLYIKESKFQFRDDSSTNLIESAQASYGQLIINVPNGKSPIFSEITPTKKGAITFVITEEMIDEVTEVGSYDFQVRLLDMNKRSRATIPPIKDGIEIREPITAEDTNILNGAGAGLSSTSSEQFLNTFDDNGHYNNTEWKFGDRITDGKLNKIENGIYESYELGLSNISRIDNLAKLEQGSTTGDAELIDARLGADDVTYENLGSAIRTQFTNINETMTNFENNNKVILSATSEHIVNYSSTDDLISNSNLVAMACCPNDLDGGYYINKLVVYGKPNTTINISLWYIVKTYPNSPGNNHHTFTKIRDLDSAVVDSDNKATFNILTHIKQGTIVLATSDARNMGYGTYKNNKYNLFLYNNTKVNPNACRIGESFEDGVQVDGINASNAGKFELKYFTDNNAIIENDDAPAIVQNIYDGKIYDEVLNDTSERAVKNKALYNELNIVEKNSIEPHDIEYKQGTMASQYIATSISVNAPCGFNYVVNSIDVLAKSGATIRFILCTFRRFDENETSGNYNRGYFTVTEELGVITSESGHAVLTISEGLIINPDTQHIIACSSEKSIGYQKVAIPYSGKNLYAYDEFNLYNTAVGSECSTLYNYTPIYSDVPSDEAIVGTYSIAYRELETRIVTTTTNVKQAVQKLLQNSSDTPSGSGSSSSILYGKKWACCGDSVTQGVAEVVGDDNIARTYDYFISQRNNMNLYKDGISGSTMTVCPGKENMSFSLDRYKAIPKDVDYITLWFGINDSTAIKQSLITLGDISSTDTSTFYGAYNVVMRYLITNIPKAKIGIVVTHMASESVANAIRDIAKKYGVCVFDIQQDPKIPFWCPGSSYYKNTIDEEISAQRATDYWVNPSHPNIQGYEFISYPFEHWMQSL